jgi:hypothetical protein
MFEEDSTFSNETDEQLSARKKIALQRQAAGEKPGVSTGIHKNITYGYGKLSFYGFWEFPLPDGEYVG